MMYNKKIMELFLEPNHSGLLHGANASSVTTETISGDMLKMYLRIDDDEKIEDASFKALGSPALIAVTSVLMDIMIGKTLDEALLIKSKDILKVLGDLPEHKLYCIDFAFDTLQATINDYYDKLRKEEKRVNKMNKLKEENHETDESAKIEDESDDEFEYENEDEIQDENNISEKENESVDNETLNNEDIDLFED